MARMEAGGTLWGLGLALLCVLLTHDILTNRKHSWVPSALTTLAAAAVSANFGWLQTEQARHIRRICVIGQLARTGISAKFRTIEPRTQVTNISKHIAPLALGHGGPEMQTQTPINEPQIVLSVSLHRDTA